VRISKTFSEQLDRLIEQGFPKFGARVAAEKRDRVLATINQHLAGFPKKPRDPRNGLFVYPVTKTPFVVVYDYDDTELRVMFIFHARADLRSFDPAAVEW
jgi:plasmid stabilization system protein ParE